MKILVCHRPGGAFGYISDAWINCLRASGQQVNRWDGKPSSWESFNPDLYLGCSGHRQAIPVRRRAKIALHVNAYGPINTGVNEAKDAIDWVLTQKPDAVFGYGTADDRLLWSYWTEHHGINWVPMPNAADLCLFNVPCCDDAKRYNAVYLGGRWDYKARNIDPYLLPVFDQLHDCKLHGWGTWPAGYCAGLLPDDQVAAFLGSGRIGPCIAEPHTHKYGIDIPERVFKVIACGTLAIHDPVPALRKLIPTIQIAQDPEHYLQLCRHFCNPAAAAERIELTNRQRHEVLSAHTYHHRLMGLLTALGFQEAAQAVMHDLKARVNSEN